ncbi:hypothetical protein FIBSPDRAFT_942318 [Athelia psychrophila]|uniref:Calcineurin-like phosphoesterase domain-containing protein n=1 Tax=Athelia psychrophila TaxID=1759441 RepID=A0A166WVU5_9AGAM|nr:hypothetical protein FIBSPDRAFT_942318 [Fibularhizoctonia sp. CBS 109695]
MHPRNSSPAVPSRGLLVNVLRVLWIAVVLWCEVGVFFSSLHSCNWPDASIAGLQHGTPTPAHVLLISDPQINHSPAQGLVPTSWAGLRQALSHADMRKAWRLTRRLRPQAVICLGDMLASGRTAQSDQQYEEQYNAFREVFPLDGAVPMYYLPGNNDVGLGRSPTISTLTRARYTRHFGPPNQVLRLGGHDLVLLDAPGLVEEDYQRHASARAKKGKRQADGDYAYASASTGAGVGVGGVGAGGGAYAGYEGVKGGAVEFVKGLIENATGTADVPRILLTHIPLAHPESARGGMACGPLRERGGTLRRGVGRGWQNTLDRATSERGEGGVRPRAVFSGDDRDYCEYTHPQPHGNGGVGGGNGEGVREVTIKSFSLANNIRRPGFQLLSLAPPPPPSAHSENQHTTDQGQEQTEPGKTWADAPCALPDRRALLTTFYVPLTILTALALLLSNLVLPNLRPVRMSSKPLQEGREGKEGREGRGGRARPGALHLAPFAFTPPAGTSAPDTPWGPLSPFTPFPDAHSGSGSHSGSAGRPKVNVRIPSAAGAGIGLGLGLGVGQRSGSTSGTDTPLLTPSAHEEDGGGYAHWAGDAEGAVLSDGDGEGYGEGDAEGEGEFFPHQYDADHHAHARARTHWPDGEHGDEYAYGHGEEAEGSYFLPAPSTSPRAGAARLAGGSGSEAWTCSFVLGGRRRRITLRAPTLGALLDLRELARDAWGAGTGRGGMGGLALGGRRGVRAVARGVLGDALRVLGPTGAVWWAVVWLAF